MAFQQISPNGPGRSKAASSASPDPWELFRALRDARGAFGLKPGHLQTLQALLSFLKPGQGDTVFASNVEICRRTGGVDERTLRRHVDHFARLGFLRRHDSPNGKRYRVSSGDGATLSFGLSLAPLFDRATELLTAAAAAEEARRTQVFLRKQLLTKLARIEVSEPADPVASSVRKALRRKLATADYHALLELADARLQEMSTVVDVVVSADLSANDGQNVRHLSMSEKGSNDSEGADPALPEIPQLTAVCTEAVAFAATPLQTWSEIRQHAGTLAPMMGIPPEAFALASRAIGHERASAAVFILLQLGQRVRNFAAYFQSITLGRKAQDFHPARLLDRLARTAARSA